MDYIQLIQLFYALLIVVAVVVLMLKQKHSTGFTLLWALIALGALFFGLFPGALFYLSTVLGIDYPPTLVLVTGVTIIIGNLFFLYAIITNSQKRIIELSMQVTLLNEEVQNLKKEKTKPNE